MTSELSISMFEIKYMQIAPKQFFIENKEQSKQETLT